MSSVASSMATIENGIERRAAHRDNGGVCTSLAGPGSASSISPGASLGVSGSASVQPVKPSSKTVTEPR
jgi:hypothetical protein